jgi:hypothetical protein
LEQILFSLLGKSMSESYISALMYSNQLKNGCSRTMIIERYPLLNEANRTIDVFEKNGKFYGHILKDATTKSPAMIVFETEKYDSMDALKVEYPVKDNPL